jgi:hypothetical protein
VRLVNLINQGYTIMSDFYFVALIEVLNESQDHANVLRAREQIKANREETIKRAQIKQKEYLARDFALVTR